MLDIHCKQWYITDDGKNIYNSRRKK